MKEQKNLFLIGTGGGMMHDIQMMSMHFQYYQQVELDRARELILYVMDEYLSDINSNLDVRPYLHEYPFAPNNIMIDIHIREPDGTSPPADKIDYFSAINGILTYYIEGPEKYSQRIVCKETYEEAKVKDRRFKETGQTTPPDDQNIANPHTEYLDDSLKDAIDTFLNNIRSSNTDTQKNSKS